MHGVPRCAEAVRAVYKGDDVDGGDTGDFVHRHVVVLRPAAFLLQEIFACACQCGGFPGAQHDVAGIAQRNAFVAEAGIFAAHHVEQDAVACGIAFSVRVVGPVTRTHAPVCAVVGPFFPVRRTVVFGVETDEVDAHARIELLQKACHFEHHAHAARAVVGSHHGLAVARAVGVGIGPRTAFPVRADDDAVGEFGAIGGDDVARLEHVAVPRREADFLFRDFQPQGLKPCRDVVAAAAMGFRVGHARPEVALRLDGGKCRVGDEAHAGDACRVYGVGRRGLRIARVFAAAYEEACHHEGTSRKKAIQ